MDEWRKVRLSELGEVNRGKSRHRPRDAAHLYGGPYPFIQTGDIKASNGCIKSHTQTYSEAGLKQSRLWPAGTMTITIAANIAETAILTYPACFPDSVVGFIANPQKANVRFVEYLFRQLKRQIQHENVGTGSVQDNINLQTLSRLELIVPELHEQNKIVSVLGALDDKIELNRQMNETLEAMARAIFKDWFVDFGPTRAKMEGRAPYLAPDIWSLFPDRLDDEGKPEGWVVVPLSTLIEINPSERLARGKLAPYLEMASIPTEGPNPASHIAREFGSGMRFRNDDTLLARITPCLENGKTAFVQNLPKNEVGWGSTEFIVLRPRPPLPKPVAYLLARDPAFRAHAIRSMTGTSGRQRASNDAISAYPLVKPDGDELWNHLHYMITSMFERIAANSEESKTLSSIRDFLLPKLMSGEVKVHEAESILGKIK